VLKPGDTLDRFTVEALLGEGGMAAVYRLRHNTLGSAHALKLLRVRGDEIRQRMDVEGRIQASLRHPNIVAVHDVLVVGGQAGLVMELVDGPSLEDWLVGHEPSIEEALGLFRGIVAGVARAHREGLVHRDLKPGNVLLAPADGGLFVPKVTDFGLAKVLGQGMSQTRTGVALGTPQYMAPEQVRNAKDVDRRADVFALGCILYHLVVGARPFDGPDIVEIYAAICSARYRAPDAARPGLPPRVVEVIRCCLELDREARYPDGDALSAALYGPGEGPGGGVRVDDEAARRRRVHREPIALVEASTRYPGAPAAAANGGDPPGRSTSVQPALRAAQPSPGVAAAPSAGRTGATADPPRDARLRTLLVVLGVLGIGSIGLSMLAAAALAVWAASR
jgi:serine/threonine-protein kinase